MMHYQPQAATCTTANPLCMRATVSNILPGKLYLSGITAVTSESILSAYKITHVLSILSSAEAIHLPETISHHTIPLSDTTTAPLLAHLPAAVDFIATALEQNKDARVLVHCVEGISRSASAVIGYLVSARGMTFRQALRIVKHRRSVVCPNLGFVRQLNEWGTICEARVEERVWEKVLKNGRQTEVEAVEIKAEGNSNESDNDSGLSGGTKKMVGERKRKRAASFLTDWIYGMSREIRRRNL